MVICLKIFLTSPPPLIMAQSRSDTPHADLRSSAGARQSNLTLMLLKIVTGKDQFDFPKKPQQTPPSDQLETSQLLCWYVLVSRRRLLPKFPLLFVKGIEPGPSTCGMHNHFHIPMVPLFWNNISLICDQWQGLVLKGSGKFFQLVFWWFLWLVSGCRGLLSVHLHGPRHPVSDVGISTRYPNEIAVSAALPPWQWTQDLLDQGLRVNLERSESVGIQSHSLSGLCICESPFPDRCRQNGAFPRQSGENFVGLTQSYLLQNCFSLTLAVRNQFSALSWETPPSGLPSHLPSTCLSQSAFRHQSPVAVPPWIGYPAHLWSDGRTAEMYTSGQFGPHIMLNTDSSHDNLPPHAQDLPNIWGVDSRRETTRLYALSGVAHSHSCPPGKSFPVRGKASGLWWPRTIPRWFPIIIISLPKGHSIYDILLGLTFDPSGQEREPPSVDTKFLI